MGTILKNLIPARSLDKNGVPVMVGDLLKVYHFTAIRKRKVYMYKIVADLPGQGVRALDAIDVATKGAQKAQACAQHSRCS